MTFAQLKEMRDNGMEIGSHSMSHDNLTKIAPHFLPWEIYQPLNLFYEQMGFWLSGIAFPNGAYNELVLAEIRKYHKYEYGFSGEPGANTEKLRGKPPLPCAASVFMTEAAAVRILRMRSAEVMC